MIRAYTTNDEHAAALAAASQLKGYPLDTKAKLDAAELAAKHGQCKVLVFDLTCASLSVDNVVSVLDSLNTDNLPPVLYFLSSPADIELITTAGSIINQDYTFVPVDAKGLAARLEVLTILGARRKLTLESAITDRLTGLYNRKYFLRRLEEELYRSARYNYKVGVLLATVDFDTPSHKLTEDSATDAIKAISAFFTGRLRKTDIVARYKWDDFAVLLPDIAAEDSLAVAADIRAKLEALPVKSNGSNLKMNVSLGHLSFPAGELGTAVEVISALEDCVFRVKTEHAGSGLVSFE
jgi:diguanylate cyclase (GGDEF)-like protein